MCIFRRHLAWFPPRKLTEEEKLIKPDYLLDPEDTKDLLTTSQKASALAILVVERPIRKAYGMPTEEVTAEIARLAAEINHPVGIDESKDMPLSERIRKTYEMLKERGDLSLFWQIEFASQNEAIYIIANNPDIAFRNFTEEQNTIILFPSWGGCVNAKMNSRQQG